MRTKSGLITIMIVFAMILAGGIFLLNGEKAESQQPDGVSFVSMEFDQGAYSSFDLSPTDGIEVAQQKCGNETCSANQCCCLNIDTGAQCCRPKKSDNCVQSCKKSKPC